MNMGIKEKNNIQFDIMAMILSFMVVMIHSSYTAFYNAAEWVSVMLDQYYTEYIPGLAVPTFFMLSAIKYYKNYDYSKTASKWRSRVSSLLIPYLCWNLLSVIWAIAFSYAPVLSDLVAVREKFSFTASNILGGLFWFKYIHPFWYLAMLMVFTLLSPIIFSVIKNKYIGILILVVLYCTDAFVVEFPHTSWPMFQIRTIVYCTFFYIFGAMLGRYYYGWICKKKSSNIWVWTLLFILSVFLRGVSNNSHVFFVPLILLGAFSLWNIAGSLDIKDSQYLKVSFFIYPAHTFVLPCVNKILYFLLPDGSLMCVLNTICGTILTYGICIVLALLAKSILPKTIWKILNGNRM